MPHRPQAPATSQALVWFKRDLRQDDHAPLAAAQHFESALGLFIIEPEWLASPEFSTAHLQFVLDSLAPLRPCARRLHRKGKPLLRMVGSGELPSQFLSQGGWAGLDGNPKGTAPYRSHLGWVPSRTQCHVLPTAWQYILKVIVMSDFFDQGALQIGDGRPEIGCLIRFHPI